MNCHEFQRWLASQTGALSTPPASIADHVRACAACTRDLAAEVAVRTAVRDYDWPDLPDATRNFVSQLQAGRAPLGSPAAAASANTLPVRRVGRQARGGRFRIGRVAEVTLVTVGTIGVLLALLAVPRFGTVRQPNQVDPSVFGPPASVLSDGRPVQYADRGIARMSGADVRGRVPMLVEPVPLVPTTALRTCTAAVWTFGDGTQLGVPCPTVDEVDSALAATTGAYPGVAAESVAIDRLAVQHVFSSPGIFYPTLAITTADGLVIVPTMTVIAQAAPSGSRISADLIGGFLSLAALVIAFAVTRATSRRRRITLAVVAGLVLSFAPFVSLLPNPIGFAFGRYLGASYDPKIGLYNRFVIATDPTAHLRPALDALIGNRGLDPLDPESPLAAYDFVNVHAPAARNSVTVTLSATYANGESRQYELPVRGHFLRGTRWEGLWRQLWSVVDIENPLGRLRTEHRELSGLPFGDSLFSDVRRLDLDSETSAVLAHPANWGWTTSCQGSDAVTASPDGSAFVVVRAPGYRATGNPNPSGEAWLIRPGSGGPILLGRQVVDHGFTLDGRYVFAVTARGDHAALIVTEVASSRVVLDVDHGPEPRSEPLSLSIRPGVSGQPGESHGSQLWIARDNGFSTLSVPDGEWKGRTTVPLWAPVAEGPRWAELSPDGSALAYACRLGLCIWRDARGTEQITQDMSVRSIGSIERLSWSPSGEVLAVVGTPTETQGVLQGLSGPRSPFDADAARSQLFDVSRSGSVGTILNHAGESSPESGVDRGASVNSPGWLGSSRVLLSVCIAGGRRMVVADFAEKSVRDVTPARWDAWVTVAPGGSEAILYTGRGSLWRATVR